ncbi:phosphatidylserine synthase [Bacillus toyonensis]|uniref:phospholipase D-like domain-containing protein n=1 Tax=Bacillus toyonensis TaxID=155322 RepID=UPI000BF4C8BD|nr:phospholipase D-like domain-containing protein [Bacillus toyonensis]PGB81742.1 phosphatidylserine synthase [Bacillus toyonensis]
MNEQTFLKTMTETVKYDDYDNKSELLTILRNSLITYDKTQVFADKPRHFREYIDLRVPVPMLKEAKKLKDVLETLTSSVYMETGNYEFWGLNIKPKPVELENEENIEHDVVFDEIKDTIIQGIRNAKYTIWIAVAWFTDKEIFDELVLRKEAGVNVRIITSDADTNSYLIEKLKSNFDLVQVSRIGKNMFHDKFCIIDLEYVMHGSYNWSVNARSNDETLATALDRDFVRKFADEFLSLYIENEN